jgi:hypothetical protein
MKPNLPSFDLPPPPSPPRHARDPANAGPEDLSSRRSSRRVRSLTGLSHEELAALAANRAPFQSPLPPSGDLAPQPTVATAPSPLLQFTAYAIPPISFSLIFFSSVFSRRTNVFLASVSRRWRRRRASA